MTPRTVQHTARAHTTMAGTPPPIPSNCSRRPGRPASSMPCAWPPPGWRSRSPPAWRSTRRWTCPHGGHASFLARAASPACRPRARPRRHTASSLAARYVRIPRRREVTSMSRSGWPSLRQNAADRHAALVTVGGRKLRKGLIGEEILIERIYDSHGRVHQRVQRPRVLGTPVAHERPPVRRLVRRLSLVYGHQPQVGASLRHSTRSTRRSHADPARRALLRPEPSQSPVVHGGAQNHAGRCGTRRLGRGGDRCKRGVPSTVPPAHHDERGPGVLDRRLWQSHAHVRTERLHVGPGRVDLVPAGDADHVRSIRALAGPVISNTLFGAGVGAVVLGMLGGPPGSPADSGRRTAPIRGSSRPRSSSCGSWS